MYDMEPEVRGNGAWAIGELFKGVPLKSRKIVQYPLEFLCYDSATCHEVDEEHVLHQSRVADNAKNALRKLGFNLNQNRG